MFDSKFMSLGLKLSVAGEDGDEAQYVPNLTSFYSPSSKQLSIFDINRSQMTLAALLLVLSSLQW
jgi:hypothetical protein